MKTYNADFYFRDTSLKQRKLSAKIIFINVVKTSNFIFFIIELNQFINIVKTLNFISFIIELN